MRYFPIAKVKAYDSDRIESYIYFDVDTFKVCNIRAKDAIKKKENDRYSILGINKNGRDTIRLTPYFKNIGVIGEAVYDKDNVTIVHKYVVEDMTYFMLVGVNGEIHVRTREEVIEAYENGNTVNGMTKANQGYRFSPDIEATPLSKEVLQKFLDRYK